MHALKFDILLQRTLYDVSKSTSLESMHTGIFCEAKYVATIVAKTFSSQGFLSEHYLQCSGWHCAWRWLHIRTLSLD